ncbi:hypothetical protein BC826DRAFT_1174170 [Russula brevipes]|nr:hypothetical protein BC826DRAFT_1174170 [Russula brevipes]
MTSHMGIWKKLLGCIAKITKFSRSRIRKSDQSPVPTNIIAHVTDAPSEGLRMEERLTHLQGFYGQEGLCQATIDKLTDDALLEIFDVYLEENRIIDEWHTLVHVCRRWRNIVFASPHRLDLQVLCRGNRPVRATLDIWPVLPLEFRYHWAGTRNLPDKDDVIAALEHRDRVRKISLSPAPNPVWEAVIVAMQVPFPELTYLSLWSGLGDRSVPALPDLFLGGSAPRLQSVSVAGIPFPGVHNLLLSASDLVDLELGMADYSEHLLARIDTPVLYELYIGFSINPVIDIPHLKQFIGRGKGLNPLKVAKLWFNSDSWTIGLQSDQLPGPWFGVRPEGIYDLESIQFLEILRPFTAIRSLYVSKTLVPFIAPALQELIGESKTEVLPNLRDLFLGGSVISRPVQKGIQAFIEAQRLSSRPVTVHH